MTPHRDLVMEYVARHLSIRELPESSTEAQQEAAIEVLAGLVMVGIAWTVTLLVWVWRA